MNAVPVPSTSARLPVSHAHRTPCVAGIELLRRGLMIDYPHMGQFGKFYIAVLDRPTSTAIPFATLMRPIEKDVSRNDITVIL